MKSCSNCMYKTEARCSDTFACRNWQPIQKPLPQLKEELYQWIKDQKQRLNDGLEAQGEAPSKYFGKVTK